MNEWPLTQRISSPDMRVQISVLEESVQCVAKAQLQLEFPLSFTSASKCLPITPFHIPASFLTCALKFPKTVVDSKPFASRH